MRTKPFIKTAIAPARTAARVASFCAVLSVLSISPSQAAGLQTLHHHVPAAVKDAKVVRRSARWEWMDLAIGLPLQNREQLTNLLQQIYDPASPNYHHYLTPEQFAEQFGPSKADYEAVVNFAKSQGLQVTGRHSNRTIVSVRGTVADVEKAFHVALHEYQHPIESRTFRAPDVEPSLDLTVPVLAVSGLDNFVIPHPCLRTLPMDAAKPAITGSGPGGYFLGSDFRHAYAAGTPFTGAGQAVGLFELDGYYHADVAAYESLAGLPNVPVTTVLLDGFSGNPGNGNIEVSLDIDMAIAMAPGLSQVIVYEGTVPNDVLNRIATDKLCNQASASWTYGVDATTIQIFQQYALQGQSFFNASGDGGAYSGSVSPPTDVPYITVVGGTDLTTGPGGGAWVSETAWPSAGGGISPTYTIPSWQQGIDMTANKGSTSYRNLPDVAMIADNCYLIANNGVAEAGAGTSIATPLWAAFIALVNQAALTNGQPVIGFLNPVVYGMGKGSNAMSYTSLFHDITTGNNGSSTHFPAVTGYDLCTGWGTPTGTNLISALAFPESLRITPANGFTFTGPVGGPFTPSQQTYVLTNNAITPVTWSLTNSSTSTWLNVSGTGGTLLHGGPSMAVTASLAASATNLPAGSYSTTLVFSNLSDKFVQTRRVTLAVVTPPVITAQPTNQALLVGTTANFSLGIASNALVFYQWQENGINLSDTGNISGSTASVLTISDVSSANVGAYSVILSNAAGMVASSNALLTIMHSEPVIVQQPTNQTVLPGAPASFSVASVGDTPYLYHWQVNGTNLANGANFSGVTTSNLTVNSASPATVGAYSVVVSNTLGSVASTGAVLSLVPVTSPGVTLQTLWSFAGGNSGASPASPLARARDGSFYGTTISGGRSNDGTFFRVTTNGSLSTFFTYTGGNGSVPYAGPVLGRDGFFYGSTFNGGTYGDGTTAKLGVSGAFTSLGNFNGNNGMNPVAGFVQGIDGNFYGTAYQGGDYGFGTLFRMAPGGALTTLVSFNGNDGEFPSGVLVQGTDGNFYGTAENGGTAGGAGTVFKMTPAGILTVLYSFSGGNDGSIPVAGLVEAVDGNFYGTTFQGGAGGFGTVFEITPSGSLTTLYSFLGGNDGANPWGGLVQASDGNLYGTTQGAGTYGSGTIFRIAPDGPLTTIAQFDGYAGATPQAALVQGLDGALYGTTEAGGSIGDGTIYRLSFNGPLQISGQPEDQSAYLGGSVLFTVATSGNAPVFYQWQQDGVNLTDGGNISGSTTATLRITNVTLADAALYSVIVSNSLNYVTSDDAALEVIYSPAHITGQPVSQTVVAGTSASFSVTAIGDQPLSYQWQENGTNLVDGGNISGSSASTLTIANATMANAGSFSVIVSNTVHSVTSSPALLTVVPVVPPWAAATNLHFFTDGSDGAFPYAGLIQAKDGNLYGVAEGGGLKFAGCIFRLTTNGVATTIYNFLGGGGNGAQPYGRLVQASNGNFFGTTSQGGSSGYGTLFRLNTNSVVAFLYSFTDGIDGALPAAGLAQGADGNFYGSTYQGGASAEGSLFVMTPNGAFTPLYSFSGGSDGANPYAGLVQGRDGNFYGTTIQGGADGYGTVFSLTTNGLLTTLATFNFTNGAFPQAGLIQGADGNLYGTTLEGGSIGYGTVFTMSTNGALTTLFSFGLTNGSGPAAELVQGTDGNFYGTTSAGGPGGQGSAFKITTNGTLSTLLWFDGFNGASPNAPLVQATDGNFYGTTPSGGTGFNPSAGGGNGTIFRLTIPVFISSSFAAASAIATLPYSSTMTNTAIAPPGDALTFAKVGGPGWLNVATNGILSGTPTNSDIGTNTFLVSLTDSYGVSATASMSIIISPDPPPSFLNNPFAEPWANVDEAYAATISTNATAPYINAGDVLTFAKVSGPAWLNVAANGTLSGTPEGLNGGSNTFVVSVTDLGGSTVTATMVVYVNSAPTFTNLSKPAAAVGLPYSGTIATNATDPDIPAGDTLTFYKVSGPAWLNVATNGALSGVASNANLGVNTFLMLVVDSGGLAGVGSLQLIVNADHSPAFISNPFVGPAGNAGQPYSGNIATNATDPDFGDLLTFSKVSGPSWLTVAGNGALSGTPLSSNAGTNSFVVSVADFDGLSTNSTMYISVTAVPIVASISLQGTNLLLNWSGGLPPYQLQVTTNAVSPTWQNVGNITSGTNLTLPPSNAAAFYRIQGQ